MTAQRKLQKQKPANDLPKRTRRRVLVTFAPNPKTLGKAVIGGVLFLAFAFVALAVALIPGEAKKSAPVAEVIRQPAPAPAKNALADLQVPASVLTPGAPADRQTIDIVAAKLGDLPVLSKKGEVRMAPEETGNSSADLVRAHTFLDAGDLGTALALYDRILAADPHNHDALAGVIYIRTKHRDMQQAEETSLRLLKFYPDDTAAKANLAHILAKEGKVETAIHYLDLAAREAPGYLPYRLDLATLYDRAGYANEALMLYRQVADKADDDESNLSLPRIQERIAYLERSGTGADGPSSTSPVDNR